MDNRQDTRSGVEEQWRDWSLSEPAIDEGKLREDLLRRIPARTLHRRTRLVLVAAAASLLAVLIGLESTRRLHAPPIAVETPPMVHEAGDGVILILREGKGPIYVLTEPTAKGEGER
jgi:hypothetical protein